MRRAAAFIQAFPENSAEYETDPWLNYTPTELQEKARYALTDAGCQLFDLFRPVRDPRLVAVELNSTKTLLHILSDLQCSLCNGICRQTTAVKECCHRFCNECISAWIRRTQRCPTCSVRVPSRRALRHDETLDALIDRLLPPKVDKFEAVRKQLETMKKPTDLLLPAQNHHHHHHSSSSGNGSSSSSSSTSSTSEDGDESAQHESEEDLEESEDEELDEEEDEEGEEDSLTGSEGPHRRKGNQPAIRKPKGKAKGRPFSRWNSTWKTQGNTTSDNPVVTAVPPVQHDSSSDEGNGAGGVEVFLVCLNHNLPPAVCSMARELSKRPMTFPPGTTTQTVGYVLASKLVRDVLGPCDSHAIVADLSFVREGDVWPAMSNVPISEVCRQVTESKGPIALRYLLSDRLFALCERIEHNYGGSGPSGAAAAAVYPPGGGGGGGGGVSGYPATSTGA